MADSLEEPVSEQIKRVLDTPRTVRLVVCGQTFEFDVLRLMNDFPNNIIVPLASRASQELQLQIDLLAMRTIYAYYSLQAVLVPQTQTERDILVLTCDFLGMPEFAEKIHRAMTVVEEGDKGLFTEEEPPPSPRGSEPFVELVRPEEKKEDHGFTRLVTQPACTLTDEDRRILLEETAQRAALGHTSLFDIFEESLEVDQQVLPYTFVPATTKLNPATDWVSSIDEFRQNLWALSYGVLEDLPTSLAVAGGAVLRCLMKPQLPSPNVLLNFKAFWLPAEFVLADLSQVLMAFSGAAQREEDPQLGLSNAWDSSLSLLLAMHGDSMRVWPRRWRRRNTPGDSELLAYVKALKNSLGKASDIDLFLLSKDPAEILRAIQHVDKKMRQVHGEVLVSRTENCITFSAASQLVPSVQIILRAYESPGQIVLGFDVDSCCVIYRAGMVLGSTRFLRAVRRGYNLVDVSRLSPTYEVRLMKYQRRGFDIAMTEPALLEQMKQLLPILTQNKHLALFSCLLGITKLAYLLIQAWHLSPRKLSQPLSDYGHRSLKSIVIQLVDGMETTSFVLGENLNDVLFGNVSVVPSWLHFGRKRSYVSQISKPSTLGPVRVRTSGVTDQGLFSGSFNPIQLAWYKGGVKLPDCVAQLACNRPEPCAALESSLSVPSSVELLPLEE